MTVDVVFRSCVDAIGKGVLIERESSADKEFHFQNWFADRLGETPWNFEQGGRNSYPDFSIVQEADGYELKGLAYPGRDATFDSNSQVPTGSHNGRTVYYVFGRYPKKPDGNTYPVIDLVVCHGDFLNADHTYVHKNKSVRGFGSYGDLMIRDRKMYVVPTPFHLADGLAHQLTLIMRKDQPAPAGCFLVGELTRTEASNVVVGYAFDLKTNELEAQTVSNPGAGTDHHFTAWRAAGSPTELVTMRNFAPGTIELEVDELDSET